MATYKVLQDIEAEDKLLGPLTLKQFIFAALAIAIGFAEFKLLTLNGLGLIRIMLVLVFGLPMLLFGFLAAPIGRDQPNDVWLLARLRFLFKPHRRIWDQDGMSELVTITVPKNTEGVTTNGLSQNEVKSRLSALANTLDSRGWAVKNVDINLYGQKGYFDTAQTDRLIDLNSLPQQVSNVDVNAADDILDADSNPVAQHLDQMVQASAQSHHNKVLQEVKEGTAQSTPAPAPADYWFMNQSQSPAKPPTNGLADFTQTPVITPGSQPTSTTQKPSGDEKAISAELHAKHASDVNTYASNLKTLRPLHEVNIHDGAVPVTNPPAAAPAQNTNLPSNDQRQPTPNPAILGLASNDDLNVATIARQAKQISQSDDEVVISLH